MCSYEEYLKISIFSLSTKLIGKYLMFPYSNEKVFFGFCPGWFFRFFFRKDDDLLYEFIDVSGLDCEICVKPFEIMEEKVKLSVRN